MINKKGVYKIKNTVDSKIYIGSTTKPFKVRFSQHKSELNNNYHPNTHLQNAWNKYGKDAFTFKPIMSFEDNDYILKAEQYLIDKYECYKDEIGYNKDRFVNFHNRVHLEGENNGNWNGGDVELECENCGDGYYVIPSKENTSRFCSHSCSSSYVNSGSNSYLSKLNEAQVIAVKNLLKFSDLNYKEIGNLFNVTNSAIGEISRGNSWDQIKI